MVVGHGTYKDNTEAFPLDKKTLNKIAMRSFFQNASFNGETHGSIGWLWSLEPGLRRIHTDEEDLKLALGHELEFVDAGFWLSSLAMGVVLSLESQKADPETIRSVKTNAALAAKGLGEGLFKGLLIPFIGTGCVVLGSQGNMTGALIFAFINVFLALVLRFWLIRYGYAHGIRALERLSGKSEALQRSARLCGAFIIGFLMVYLAYHIDFSLYADISGSSLYLTDALNRILPGFIMIALTMLMTYLIDKRKCPLWVCGAVILLMGLAGAFFGIWGANGNPPITWPWL